jgi:hypothetical protein
VGTQNAADLVAGGGEFGTAQKAGAPRLDDPVGGQASLAVRRGHMDVAAKADDVAETGACRGIQELETGSRRLCAGRRLARKQASSTLIPAQHHSPVSTSSERFRHLNGGSRMFVFLSPA